MFLLSNCVLCVQTTEHCTAVRMGKLKPHTVILMSHKHKAKWKQQCTKIAHTMVTFMRSTQTTKLFCFVRSQIVGTSAWKWTRGHLTRWFSVKSGCESRGYVQFIKKFSNCTFKHCTVYVSCMSIRSLNICQKKLKNSITCLKGWFSLIALKKV